MSEFIKINKECKYLLFTSAGDKCIITNNKYWVSNKNDKNFDIFICFYGSNEEIKNKIKNESNYFVESKGGKFENLIKVYLKYKNLFETYDFVFVIDDDILINTIEINFLFRTIEYLNCCSGGNGPSLIQPSLINDKSCRIDHPITKQNKKFFAHSSNFIEMNVPLFRAKELYLFLDYLISLNEPVLKGAGMDFMYCDFLNRNGNDKFYVIDAVGCINLINNEENREICKLQSTHERYKHWEELKKKYLIRIKKNFIKSYINECPKELIIDLSRLSKIESNLSDR